MNEETDDARRERESTLVERVLSQVTDEKTNGMADVHAPSAVHLVFTDYACMTIHKMHASSNTADMKRAVIEALTTAFTVGSQLAASGMTMDKFLQCMCQSITDVELEEWMKSLEKQ